MEEEGRRAGKREGGREGGLVGQQSMDAGRVVVICFYPKGGHKGRKESILKGTHACPLLSVILGSPV